MQHQRIGNKLTGWEQIHLWKNYSYLQSTRLRPWKPSWISGCKQCSLVLPPTLQHLLACLPWQSPCLLPWFFVLLCCAACGCSWNGMLSCWLSTRLSLSCSTAAAISDQHRSCNDNDDDKGSVKGDVNIVAVLPSSKMLTTSMTIPSLLMVAFCAIFL